MRIVITCIATAIRLTAGMNVLSVYLGTCWATAILSKSIVSQKNQIGVKLNIVSFFISSILV